MTDVLKIYLIYYNDVAVGLTWWPERCQFLNDEYLRIIEISIN